MSCSRIFLIGKAYTSASRGKHTEWLVRAKTKNHTLPSRRMGWATVPSAFIPLSWIHLKDLSYPALSNIYQHGRNILICKDKGPHDFTMHLLLQSCNQLYTILYSLCCALLTPLLSSNAAGAGVTPACTSPRPLSRSFSSPSGPVQC